MYMQQTRLDRAWQGGGDGILNSGFWSRKCEKADSVEIISIEAQAIAVFTVLYVTSFRVILGGWL